MVTEQLEPGFATVPDKTLMKWVGGGGYFLCLQWINWQWQFGWKDEWTPESTTNLGWSVKIKSVQESDWGSIHVGSDISCWYP